MPKPEFRADCPALARTFVTPSSSAAASATDLILAVAESLPDHAVSRMRSHATFAPSTVTMTHEFQIDEDELD